MRNSENLALRAFKDLGLNPDDYEGNCVEARQEVEEWAKEQGHTCTAVNFDSRFCGVGEMLEPQGWGLHAATIIDGLVHDLWCKDPLHVEEYIEHMFMEPCAVRYFLWDGKDFYTTDGVVWGDEGEQRATLHVLNRTERS